MDNASKSSRKSQPDPMGEEDFYLNNDDDEEEDNYSENANDEEMSELDEYLDQPMHSISTHHSTKQESSKESALAGTCSKKASIISGYKPVILSDKSDNKKVTIDNEDEFKYEVLTPDKIVHFMIECIKDVNQVLELSPTTTRILLHHFRWDKEKLMERFYDGDQDRLFDEAHIVNPFKNNAKKVRD